MRATPLVFAALFLTAAADAANFTVTNVNDSGAGSLRQAIQDVNASGDASNTITFSIGSGAATIKPATAWGSITRPVTIDATTQPGFETTPLITLDGSGFTGPRTALRLAGGNSTVTGLKLVNWNDPSFGSAAIAIASTGNTISRNTIGVPTIAYRERTNDAGIWIAAGSNNTTITDNGITGNRHGIELAGGQPTTGLVIQRNQIGTTQDGNTVDAILNDAAGAIVGGINGQGNALCKDLVLNGCTGTIVTGNTGNGNGQGLVISGGGNHQIGGPPPAGNRFSGWSVTITDSAHNKIEGNTFLQSHGIKIIGSGSVPNAPLDNMIGGTNAGTGNTITLAFTHVGCEAAIRIVNATGCSILGNVLTGWPNIDLGEDCETTNDPGDSDTGANNIQNYPILTRAVRSGGTWTIIGTLNSTPSSTFRVEFFASGYLGPRYLGFTNVTTDANGNASFTATVTGGDPNAVFAATATDSLGNTSEYSHGVSLDTPGTLSIPYQYSVAEGDASFAALVRRTNGAAGTVTVDYWFKDGTAVAGIDYVGHWGTLTFLDGEISKPISIPILDDSVYQASKTFELHLSNPTGGVTIDRSMSVITIADDEKPPVLSFSNVQSLEGNSGITTVPLPLTLSSPAPIPIRVYWATASNSAIPGKDYVQDSGFATFNPGETTKTISLRILANTTYEPNKNFYIFLVPEHATIEGYNFAVCFILNDDEQPLATADDVRVLEGNSGTTDAIVTLRANMPLTGSVSYQTVDGTAVAGRDYLPASGYVSFSNQTQRQIAIPIVGDTEVAADKQFTVHLQSTSLGLQPTDITVTIGNDDLGIGPRSQTIPQGSSGGIVVDIGNPARSAQTIAVSTTDPCITAPATVQMAAGRHSINVPVQAVSAPCSARVDVALPAALGGTTLSAAVVTYRPLSVAFDPASPHLIVGQTLPIRLTVSPLEAPAVVALSALGGTVDIPPNVTVGPSGGSFAVTALKPGPMTVRATLPSERGGGTADLFGEIAEAPPTVTILQIAPASGPTAGGTPVILTGTNFARDCTFAFGGVPAPTVAFASPTMMSATTPAHVAGLVDVTVTCGADSFTFASAFTYAASAPVITGVVPSFGSTLGGTTVRISGRDFQPSCWPFFDGAAARHVSVPSTTEMIASAPQHAAGAATVSVRCTAAEARLQAAFTYSTAEEPSPVITAVVPTAAAPGESVRIAGSRFRTTDSVAFDTTDAPLLDTTPDSHVVTVPALPLGTVSVNVADAAGHLSTTGPIFLVLEPAPPRVTRISPPKARADAEVTIEGSGFRAPYGFRLGGVAMPVTTLSFARAVLRVPAGLAAGAYELRIVNGSGNVAAIGGTFEVTPGGIVVGSVSPDCASTEAGITITIAGSGFAAGAKVTIGDTPVTDVKVVDESHITATLPSLAPGSPAIVVTNPNGESGMATHALRVDSPFDPDRCSVTVRRRPAHG